MYNISGIFEEFDIIRQYSRAKGLISSHTYTCIYEWSGWDIAQMIGTIIVLKVSVQNVDYILFIEGFNLYNKLRRLHNHP